MKLYAIKRPDGTVIQAEPSYGESHAWFNAYVFECPSPLNNIEHSKNLGYRCVEVELAEPGTTEALKRARLAWDALVSIGARVDCGVANAANADVRDSAVQVLSEVLGRVTDNAEGGES